MKEVKETDKTIMTDVIQMECSGQELDYVVPATDMVDMDTAKKAVPQLQQRRSR